MMYFKITLTFFLFLEFFNAVNFYDFVADEHDHGSWEVKLLTIGLYILSTSNPNFHDNRGKHKLTIKNKNF